MASVRAAEGDTGAPRTTGGQASGDAFSKREKANEDFYVREQEKQKLLELKEKLRRQKAEISQLDEHIAEIEKKSKQ